MRRLCVWWLGRCSWGFWPRSSSRILFWRPQAVLSAAGCWAFRRSPLRMGAVVAGYAFAVMVAWIAAGQDLGNLYPYIRQSLEISSGYAGAMGFDEPRPRFSLGLGPRCPVPSLCRRRLAMRAGSGVCDGGLRVIWLSPCLWSGRRASSGPIWFPWAATYSGSSPMSSFWAPRSPGWRFRAGVGTGSTARSPLCLIGIAALILFFTGRRRVSPGRSSMARRTPLRALAPCRRRGSGHLRRRAHAWRCPGIDAAVGDATVDVYDYSIGIALLNGLRLSSRPVFQSYSAYTPRLEASNLSFYQSQRAPDFLIWKGEGVDGRYPGQDDALLVAALPGHYEALFEEGGYWLFRKRSPLSGGPPARGLVLIRTVGLSQEIELPPRLEKRSGSKSTRSRNAFGRLRGILYKPALINIATTDNRGQKERGASSAGRKGRLHPCPDACRRPRPRAPHGGKARARSGHFISRPRAGKGEYWSRVDVSVFEIPGCRVHRGPAER